MGRVDNVILNVSIIDGGLAKDAFQAPIQRGQSLLVLGLDDWGGAKAPEVNLFAAAFNRLHWPTLFARVEGVSWQDPAELTLMIRAENLPGFGVYRLRAGKLGPENVVAALQLATLGSTRLGSRSVRSDVTGDEAEHPLGNWPRTEAGRSALVAAVVAMLTRTEDEVSAEIDELR